MPSAPAIFLLIFAFNACIVRTNPIPDNSPPPTLQYGVRAGFNITIINDTICTQDYDSSLIVTEWDFILTYRVMISTNFTIQSYNLSRFLSSEERLD